MIYSENNFINANKNSFLRKDLTKLSCLGWVFIWGWRPIQTKLLSVLYLTSISSQSCWKPRNMERERGNEKKMVPLLAYFQHVVPVIFIISRRAGYFLALPYHQPLIVKSRGWAACQLPVQVALSPNPDLIIEGNGFSRGINASYQVSKWNNLLPCVCASVRARACEHVCLFHRNWEQVDEYL